MVGTVGFVCRSSFWIAAQILNSSILKKMLCDFQKHKIYTKIIDKNRVKMDSLQRRFSWIFLMKTSQNLSCIWKPLKWGFQMQERFGEVFIKKIQEKRLWRESIFRRFLSMILVYFLCFWKSHSIFFGIEEFKICAAIQKLDGQTNPTVPTNPYWS